MTSSADTPVQSKLPLLHPDRLPVALKTKIDREVPWVSLAPPTDADRARDVAENERVFLEQIKRLPELARHLGIDPGPSGSSAWVCGLSIRLAQELQIPGFQERWVGPEADKMRLITAGRRLYGGELGTAIVGHPAGSNRYTFTVDGGQIPADPITSFTFAEVVRSDGRAATDREVAEVLVDVLMPEYRSRRSASNAGGTRPDAITKISKLISQGRQSFNKT